MARKSKLNLRAIEKFRQAMAKGYEREARRNLIRVPLQMGAPC